jgi:large subunit ribosomal protein L4
MMIRVACRHRGGLTRRLTAITQQQQHQQQHARPTHCHLVGSSRLLSAQPLDDEEDPSAVPSNLRFDRKSSFAPKQRPFSVTVPEVADDDDDDDNEDVDFQKDDNGESNPVDKNDDILDIERNFDDDEDDDDFDFDKDIEVSEPRYIIPLPDRLKTDIRHGLDGSVSGSLWLDPSVFGADPIRIDLIKQSVDYIRNKIRGRRKAKTKTISEVSGSGRKVRQQKGTGAARAGHSRPAHWRGGAKAHGPKNATDYGKVKMNKKVKRLAITSVLSQKLKEGNLIVVDSLQLESHKTGPWSSLLDSAYGVGKDGSSALIFDHYNEPNEGEDEDEDKGDASSASYNGVPINLWVASGNNYKVKVANQRFCNVYDILKKEKLILTLSALEQIEARWKH